MITRKALIAGIFSMFVGIGMLAMPVRAMAHDWDHGGDGWRHGHHDNGRHLGWYKHVDDDDDYGYRGRGYYPPAYGYHQEPDEDDYGYGNGYGYGAPNGYWTGRRWLPANGNGMVSARNPRAVWTCDSGGHHCHWQRRFGAGFPTAVNPGYYGNGNYGNGYYGGYSPLGGLGSLLGIPMP